VVAKIWSSIHRPVTLLLPLPFHPSAVDVYGLSLFLRTFFVRVADRLQSVLLLSIALFVLSVLVPVSERVKSSLLTAP